MHETLQNLIGHPYAFYIGNANVTWYGLAYIITFIVGWIGLLKKFPKQLWVDWLVVTIILSGLIGAKLGYVTIAALDGSGQNMADTVMPWYGGMSWYGGVLLAIIAGVWFCKRYNINFWRIADAVTPFLLFGVALVRLANFVNGELPGVVVAEQYGVLFPGYNGFRAPQALYESGLVAILLILVILFGKFMKSRMDVRRGTVFLFAAFWLSVIRFIIEFWRESNIVICYLTGGQWLSLICIILSIFFLFKQLSAFSNK